VEQMVAVTLYKHQRVALADDLVIYIRTVSFG